MDEKVNLNVEYFRTVFCPLLPKRGAAATAASEEEAKYYNPGLPPSWQLTPEEIKKVAAMPRPDDNKKGVFFNSGPCDVEKGIFDGYPEYDEND